MPPCSSRRLSRQLHPRRRSLRALFFFNDTATTEIYTCDYTLSLHDALPIMLGAFKLGAVVIPATALLTPEDLRDRLERGRVRHVIAGSAHTEKFAALPGDYTRIGVGDAKPGWVPFDASRDHPAAFEPDAPTNATDPLLLYFT